MNLRLYRAITSNVHYAGTEKCHILNEYFAICMEGIVTGSDNEGMFA
jgi:hypothetical protein